MPVTPSETHAVARATRVTLVGAILDGALGIGKIVVGQLAHSHALFADGLHSLSDLATDIPILVLMRQARARPDADHPYGHGRFETLASLILGAVLLVVAGGLAQDSLDRLLEGKAIVPGPAAAAAALISIATKEWIFRYTRRTAEAIDSALLLANAWHSRSDAFSSIAVLVGVLGAMAGWAWLDLAAAVVVALMISRVGWVLIRDAAQELVDTGLPADVLTEVAASVRSVPGVLGVHHLRSRRMGAEVLVDVDVEVGGTLSVSEGHRIATAVSRELDEAFPAITSVNVHVDPVRTRSTHAERSDDALPVTEPREGLADAALPLRHEAEAALRGVLSPNLVDTIYRLTLHYGNQGVDVELYLESDAMLDQDETELLARLQAEGLDWLADLRLWRPYRLTR